MIKIIIGSAAGIAAFLLLIFGLNYFGYAQFAFFAPRIEAVRRSTFEQSKAYNQGMIQELQNMQFQYQQADDAHKLALASIILHRTADYNNDNLPPDLYAFVESLRHTH